MKLDILLDPSPVYTGDEVHFQFFQNCRTLWQMAHGLLLKYRKECEYNDSDEPNIFKVGEVVPSLIQSNLTPKQTYIGT